MKLANLLENLEFGNKDPHAEPLHIDRQGRAILFSLKPGQSIREHSAPSSPFCGGSKRKRRLCWRRWC